MIDDDNERLEMAVNYCDDLDKLLNQHKEQMKELLSTTLTQIYTKAILWARKNNQVVGEKNDYYITLEQLEEILKEWK